jgi:GNAT superfamily N-acetyltransferase
MRGAAAIALDWAADEGWNPGLDDAARFASADPEAFLVIEQDGAVAGTVSCALYGDAYAFIGLYIVRPDLRGQRIGRALFARALDRAGERVVGLDGVPAQQESYVRAGFVLAHRNARYEGSGGGSAPGAVVDLAAAAPADVCAYDAAIFGTERRRFLEAWTADRVPGMALAVLDGRALRGYAIGRRCRTGVKAGPLFADDAQTAEALLDGLRAAAGAGTPLFLDVPEANPEAVALARSRGMRPMFETARMYRGGHPGDDVQRVYGVTSLEFG